MKFIRNLALAAIAVLGLSAPAMAQIAGGSTLELSGNTATINGIVAVNVSGPSPFKVDFSKADESGKGTAQVALNVPDGNVLCASLVGENWGRVGNKLDPQKVFCGPIANGHGSVAINPGGDGLIAITWFIAKSGSLEVLSYAGHPYAASRTMLVQANGQRDVATVLVSRGGSLSLPTPAQLEEYKTFYKTASASW